MSNPAERYQKLGFKEALKRTHHYPVACKELSFILREAYNKLPKNLQSIIFQDTLDAFRLLRSMQTRSAISDSHLLLQSAEAVLPKQKKILAVTEFKQAKVAQKRRLKAHQEEESTTELAQDVIVHIFSFLDIQSLVSVGQVCWSWNFAASNNHLWQSQYTRYFGSKLNSSKNKERKNGRLTKHEEFSHVKEFMITRANIDWREAFKKAYMGNSSMRLASHRGYCSQCEAVVWLDNMKCCNGDSRLQCQNRQIIPVSSHQVVEYLLNGSSSMESSSDSDEESDEEGIRLWSYLFRRRLKVV